MVDRSQENLDKYAPVLVRAFMQYGLPGVWGLAIAHQETDGTFNPNAKNLSGGDGQRGGSYGLCQVSLLTARHYEPGITPEELIVPGTNADIAARICLDANRRFPQSLMNVAAMYNDGKPFASTRLAASTRDIYVPNVLRYANLHAQLAEQIEKQINAEPNSSEG